MAVLRCVCSVWVVAFVIADDLSAAAKRPLRVFVLAGQSNMEGQGVVDLDHPKYYNGGKGTLLGVMQDPKKARLFRHLRDEDGKWVVRKDVFVRFVTRHGIKKGGLSIGFAGYPGKHHIGPEFQFGHVIGDHLDDPVLLIKTAWGGKSLHKDFRPPSSGGEVGEYYKRMLAEVKEGLSKLPAEFPELTQRTPVLSGFVWFQGWNDMFNPQAREEYQANLANLIRDVRREWKSPHLPVVIGELGNGGPKAGKNMLKIRQAQASVAMLDEFRGKGVSFVSTTAFARPKEQSPNVGHGHHWFGNAESYFLIGDALGKSMTKLLK